MIERPTYDKPKDGWVCFHCGERFLQTNEARDHFGARPTATPACEITGKEFKTNLRMYRVLEETFGILDDSNKALYQRLLNAEKESNQNES